MIVAHPEHANNVAKSRSANVDKAKLRRSENVRDVNYFSSETSNRLNSLRYAAI